jgi:hypothetical protein
VRTDHAVAAAALGGVLAGIVGDVATNIFFVSGSSKVFWIVVAIGIVAADPWTRQRDLTMVTPARVSRARALLPVGGLATGLAVAALAPTHVGADYRFQTMTSRTHAAVAAHDQVSRIYVRTVCDLAEQMEGDGVAVTCIDPLLRLGIGDLRIQADSAQSVAAMEATLRDSLAPAVPGFELDRVKIGDGRPTWASTAPFWLASSGLLAALLVPPLRTAGRGGSPGPLGARRVRSTPGSPRARAAWS